ncbi:MFS general substrate transporter [Coniophora puteana RWD-64-598 SS2]|uniref:MFS general substrate transporter n=1 Tax=Coniophora puteana (strain RWD-64-598) TaxID=741705 RepID=A0A5M3N4X2_CONPW|nr:MFS general substrate transporter [Coniophora puteana RWD-64-598 SS2]EIW86443.1 MFS general substrate transporter [Coniophora puteana RWD-64-598 SS2]
MAKERPNPTESGVKRLSESDYAVSSTCTSRVPSLESQETFRLTHAPRAALTLFLATTDSTIVSTSLPTISAEFNATQSEYTWVGIAYMLTQTAFQPLYGRLSDLVGRKIVLFSSMFIFALGSLLCGAAKSMMGLILARALAGVGGGGIVSSVWVITAELVEPKRRSNWSQALSVTWSCSAVAGPILGGLFSIFLNLPVCFAAFVVLLITLHNVPLSCARDASWRSFAQKFDFVGLFLFMAGTSCIVLGCNFAMSYGWYAPITIVLTVMGPIILITGGIYEAYTKRDALFPPAAFRSLIVGTILTITFLHQFVFNAGTFYLALYFQVVNGASPLQAGIQMLPYSLGSSVASMPAAWFMSKWQERKGHTGGQNIIIGMGLLIATTGFGLMVILNERSSQALQSIFPLIAGIGVGMLFHAPYQIFTRALGPSELATGTSAFFLTRFTGATVGLSVAGMVFDDQLGHNLPSSYASLASSSSVEKLVSSIGSPSVRSKVLGGISGAISAIWIVCTPCLGVALIALYLTTILKLAFFIKRLPIEDLRESETKEPEKSLSVGSIHPEREGESPTNTIRS